MSSLLTQPRARRAIQLLSASIWLVSVIVAVWSRSVGPTIVLAVVTGVLTLFAIKAMFVQAASLRALAMITSQRQDRQRSTTDQLTETTLALRADVDDLDALGLGALRDQLDSIVRIGEAHVAQLEAQRQEILALRERAEVDPPRVHQTEDSTVESIAEEPPPVLLHYHLPKTGGKTLQASFFRSLRPGSEVLHLGRESEKIATRPSDNDGVAALRPDQRDEVQIVTGHTVDHRTLELFSMRDVRELTVLRDPAERMVSHFNFDCARARADKVDIPNFEDWYKARRPNQMSAYLSHRLGVRPAALIARLSLFWFVGDTDQMDTWLPWVCTVVGLDPPETRKNVTGIDHERVLRLDPALRARISSDHSDDTVLYERVSTELREPFLNRLRSAAERMTTGGS